MATGRGLIKFEVEESIGTRVDLTERLVMDSLTFHEKNAIIISEELYVYVFEVPIEEEE